MRIWSLHPKYLDPRGLVALWREGLLAQAVLRGKTTGYVHHPQLVRFRQRSSPIGCIAEYLRVVHREAGVRGYRFAANKLSRSRAFGRLTVTRGQLEFEWNHLRGKLRARDPKWLASLEKVTHPAPHPLFRVTRGGIAEWEKGFRPMLIAGKVTAVSRSATHTFSKANQDRIELVTGLGVQGDAHMGEVVKHRSRVARDPTQANLRQVHLIQEELHDELRAAGFAVSAGQLGENVTSRGIDLLRLPTGTRLRLGETAEVELTGLRNPCFQFDDFAPGLMAAVLGRDPHGNLLRKAGVMGIVRAGGEVRPGDPIRAELPPEPHRPLERV